MSAQFEIINEVEPPTSPDFSAVRRQVAIMTGVASSFLVPDNHVGRATVSSITVAGEVRALGGRAIACINARDRNLLGLRRDLLTAAAYGVNDFLFVYGDRLDGEHHPSGLTVRAMLDEARRFAADVGIPVPRLGVATQMGKLPKWKQQADYLLLQVSFSTADMIQWRESVDFEGPIYPAVMALPSQRVARRISERIPQLAVPDHVLAALAADPHAGVEIATRLIAEIKASGEFEGVHLCAMSRHQEMAHVLGRRA